MKDQFFADYLERLEDLDKERKDEDGTVTCGWALLHALEQKIYNNSVYRVLYSTAL